MKAKYLHENQGQKDGCINLDTRSTAHRLKHMSVYTIYILKSVIYTFPIFYSRKYSSTETNFHGYLEMINIWQSTFSLESLIGIR